MKEHDYEFQELKKRYKFDSLDKDLVLLDDVTNFIKQQAPQKIKESVSIICLQGTIELGINLKQYVFEAPCFIPIRSGTISQFIGKSDDFHGLFILMSKRFMKKMEFSSQQIMPFMFYFDKHASLPLNNEEVKMLVYSFRILRIIVSQQVNPYRIEIVRHLIHAFYYGISMMLQKHHEINNKKQSRQEEIFEDFMACVQQYYREERGLEFYANKLAITTKHLSLVIKAVSAKSANEWIDEHVVLEAKVLLKTTKMTIQQISDNLNFTDQSFFGRYFKKHAGSSPKKFRDGLK